MASLPSLQSLSKKFKEFKPTSWSIDNRTAIYIIAIMISIYGLLKFNTMPKEQFPDIAELGDPLALAQEAIERADRYGYATLSGYAHFANFIAFGGPEFDSRHLDRTAEAIRAALPNCQVDFKPMTDAEKESLLVKKLRL